MKKNKKKALVMLTMPALIAICVFSVISMANKENHDLVHEFVIDLSEKNYHKVYLLDENKYLIPLSVDVSNKEYLVDEIYTIVSNLRDLDVEGFNTVLAQDVKINKIELENGILNIDFSKEFLVYQKNLEEKIIESLTWSVMDFEQVQGLTISVEGVRLEKMPINGLQLPSVLNKDIGINKYNDLASDFINGESAVILYQKQVNGKVYYVPVTRRVELNENEVLKVINAMDTSIGVLSGLSPIEKYKEVKIDQITLEDETVNVNLAKSALIDDNLIGSDMYELLMVTFNYNNLDAKVNFFVDNEIVEVNGYNNSMEEAVSDIIFNEIPL